MTRYKHKLGNTEFDVVEKTIHLHIISRDKSGVPTEIQVHRLREWYLEGHLIKADTPTAVVVPVSSLQEAVFANTGLTLMQAIEVFDAVMAPYAPVILSGTTLPEHDPIPDHAVAAVQKLLDQKPVLEAQVAVHDELIKTKLAEIATIEEQIESLRQDHIAAQERVRVQGQQISDAMTGAMGDMSRLEATIAEKQATIEVLDQAIREKSAESTRLTISHGVRSEPVEVAAEVAAEPISEPVTTTDDRQ
jgi:hypothetical protein